jgi:hypothetical protein
MSTSEAVYYGPPGRPGGGTWQDGQPVCGAKSEPGVFPLPFGCTLTPGHQGWHEAGTTPGMMTATWSEDEKR